MSHNIEHVPVVEASKEIRQSQSSLKQTLPGSVCPIRHCAQMRPRAAIATRQAARQSADASAEQANGTGSSV